MKPPGTFFVFREPDTVELLCATMFEDFLREEVRLQRVSTMSFWMFNFEASLPSKVFVFPTAVRGPQLLSSLSLPVFLVTSSTPLQGERPFTTSSIAFVIIAWCQEHGPSFS